MRERSAAALPAAQGARSRPAPGSRGRVVYTGSDGNLYVINPDGTGRHAVTSDGSTASPYASPLWSPTGTGILAVRTFPAIQAPTSTGLWLASPSGGTPKQLAHDVPRGLAWAPDGHTVVYEVGFPPDTTSLVVYDTRTGTQHTVTCDGAFKLVGVTAIGNRAIGVQGGQIEAVPLAGGAAQTLTSYTAATGVWQNVAVLTPSGSTLLYAQAPGTHLISLDLRTGRGGVTNVSDPVVGVALSPDLRWLAYAAGASPLPQAVLVRVGKGAAGLRADSYVSPQAFAPDSAALVYTSLLNGTRTVFVAPTGCPAACAHRLDGGQDAAWGPL